jgi:glycosyltransferase involved in cell wall biosynthesis
VGAAAIRSRSPSRESLRALGVFAAVAGASFALAGALGEQPFAFALVLAAAVVIGTALFFSERYVLSLGFLLAYLALADGFLKLRYGGNAITVVRDVLVLAIAAGAIVRLAVRKTDVTLPAGTGLVLAWGVVVVVQLFNPDNGTTLHSVQALRQHVEFVPLFFFGFAVMRTKNRLRAFFLLLLVVTAINAVVALVQYQAGPEAVAAWGPGYAEKINGTPEVAGRTFYESESGSRHLRPFGLGSDVGFGGNLAVLAAPAAWAFVVLTRRRLTQIVGVILAAGVALAALTSQTRLAIIGAVVAFGGSLAFAVASRRAVVAIVAALVLGGVGYGAISYVAKTSDEQVFSRYSSLLGRNPVSSSVTYKQSSLSQLPGLVERYALGAGLGSAGPASSTPGAPEAARRLDAENEFNFLVIETGVPGLLVLLAFHLGAVLRSLGTVRRQQDPEVRLLLAGIAAPLLALLVMWFGAPITTAPPTAPFLWFAAGILAYWATVAAPSRPAQLPATMQRPRAPAGGERRQAGGRNVPAVRRRSVHARDERRRPSGNGRPPADPVISSECEIALVWGGAGRPFDGIDAYTRGLARALDEIPGYRCRISPLFGARGADVLLLQYNPFSWGRRGFAPGVPAWMARRRSSGDRPFVATMIHEPFVAPEDMRTTVMAGWQRAQLALVKALSDRVLAPSADAARRARGWGPSIAVVPVGSNLPDRRTARPAARDRLGVDDGDVVLVTFERSAAGRLHAQVAAAVEATREATAVHLLVLGAGAQAPRGVHPSVNVRVAGPLRDDEVAFHLAAGDVFLADYADGLSTRRTTLVAALQHGLPVVGTTVGRTDDCLLGCDGIVVVPAEDVRGYGVAVRSLAASGEERSRRSAAARRLFDERFDWPVVARRVLRAIGREA